MGDERFDLEDPATAVADNWDVLPKVLENQDSEEDSEDEHQAGARGTGVSAEPDCETDEGPEPSHGTGGGAGADHDESLALIRLKERYATTEIKIGRDLKALRDQQTQDGVTEYYTMEHLKRLVEWEREAIHFKRVPSGPYCKHVHGKNCTQCVTCHFCRQKWASPKTFCPCANSGRKGLVGGEQRGAWCQKCLEGRMGEDFKATMEYCRRGTWRCPCCRDICNCSGTHCQRALRNLKPTKQLLWEAQKMGYKSVAHYIILTSLVDNKGALPIPEFTELPPTAKTASRVVVKRAGGGRKKRERASAKNVQRRERRLVMSTAPLTRCLGDISVSRLQLSTELELFRGANLFADANAGDDDEDEFAPERSSQDTQGPADDEADGADREGDTAAAGTRFAHLPGARATADVAAQGQETGPRGTSPDDGAAGRSRQGRGHAERDQEGRVRASQGAAGVAGAAGGGAAAPTGATRNLNSAAHRSDGASARPGRGPPPGTAARAQQEASAPAGSRGQSGQACSGPPGLDLPEWAQICVSYAGAFAAPVAAADAVCAPGQHATGGAEKGAASGADWSDLDDELLLLDCDALEREAVAARNGGGGQSGAAGDTAGATDGPWDVPSPGPPATQLAGLNPARNPIPAHGRSLEGAFDDARGRDTAETAPEGGADGRTSMGDGGAVSGEDAVGGPRRGPQDEPQGPRMGPNDVSGDRPASRPLPPVAPPVHRSCAPGTRETPAQMSRGGGAAGAVGNAPLGPLHGWRGFGWGAHAPNGTVDSVASEGGGVWSRINKMKEEFGKTLPRERAMERRRRAQVGRRLKRARDAAATGEHAGQRAPKAPRSAATAQDKPTANKALRAPQNGHHKRSRAVLDSDSDDDDGDACGERGAVVTAEARDGGNALETAKQAHGEGDAPTADEEARGGDQGTGVGKEPANAKEAPNSDVEIDSGDEEAEMLREAAGLDQGNGGGDDTTAMDLEDVWAEAEASEEAAATTLRDATAWLRHRLKSWSASINAGRMLSELRDMLLKPEVGFGNAVCFDYSHEGESVPTEPDELERRILVVPEGCRRVRGWKLVCLTDILKGIVDSMPLQALKPQLPMLNRWFFSSTTFVNLERSIPEASILMAHTAVYVWQRLIEKGAAFKEINLLVSEIYKLMDRFLEHHESASRILRDAAQDIAEGGPSGRRTARQETLGCYVFPSCHTDDDLEARRAYGTAVRRASTRGAILLATSLAEVVIRCHDARSPALAAVLRSVIRPRLAELMTAPGPAAEEEVRQSLIILSRQAARFASGIIQSTGTSPAEKEDACHALHCAVAHVFPALDRLIFARFSVKAPKAAPRTDGDATTNANAGEAAQKTDPAHQPVEASMGHFALHGKASMHGSLLAAVLHLRGARSQVPETGSDPAALLMGLEEASWAAIERCACAPGADAATGWRKLQVYIYRKTTLEYLFLALFECAQLVKTDPCVVATIISCWIKGSIDIKMTDVIAPVTSFLRDPTVLGDSIFAGVQDVPPKDPYGGIRAKNIATVMANIASRGGELKLTQEACVVGVQDVISVNWDARHSHEPSVVFSWCTAVYNCLQAIAFAGGNLTAALLGVGPKISPPALAAAKSLASCMFQISTAPICTMKRHWAARVARDIVQGSEDGRVGFDAHLEAAMKEMSRSPLVLLSALWGLRASERSATLAMRIAEDWKRPAYATLSPLPDAILTILDISMRTAGLPAPFKVSTKDEDAGKVLLAYSHDPSGSALIDMLARAVIGANQMMPDVGVGLFRACLVVATLCREGIMAWRGSMPNMGRALACVDLAAQFMRRFQSDLSESGAVLVQLADPIIHAMFDAAETSAQGHPNDPSFLHWLLARLSRLFSDHDYLLSDLSSIPDPDGQAGGGAVGRREARRALGRVGRREVAAAVTALVAGVSDVLLSAARASAGDLLSSQGQGQGQTQGATGAGAVHEALDALMPTQTIPSQAPTQGMATQGVAPRPGSHAADLTVPAGCTEARKRVLTSHLTLALGPIFDSPIVRDRVRSQTITGALRDIRIGEIPEEVEMGEEAVAIEPRIHDAIEPTNDSMQARLLAWMPAFCEGALIVAMAACHPGVWGGMVARLLTEMHVALKAIVDALIPIAEAGRVERRTVPGITKIIRSYRDVLSSAQLLTREGLRIEGIQKLVNACDSMLEGRRGPNRHGGPGNSGRGGRGESHSHSAAAGAEHASRHVASPRQRNQGEDGAGRDGGEVTGPAAEGDTTDEGGAASAGAGPDGRAGGGGAAAVTESAGPRSAAERASGPAGDPSGSWRRVVDSGKGAPALKKRGPCTVQSCEALTSLGEDQVGQMRRVVGTIVTMHESRDRSGSVIKLVASVRLSSGPIKEKVAVVLRGRDAAEVFEWMSEQRRADQRCKVSAVITGKFVGRHTGKPRIDFGPESSALFMPMN